MRSYVYVLIGGFSVLSLSLALSHHLGTGDKVPVTFMGRLLTVVWMFVGTYCVGMFGGPFIFVSMLRNLSLLILVITHSLLILASMQNNFLLCVVLLCRFTSYSPAASAG